MTDKVIEDINKGLLTAENLTHKTLRESYRRQIYEDGRKILDRGRGILDNTDHLDQYLHSYGKMVNQQWRDSLEITKTDDEVTVIDYGCGQGLSLLNLVCRRQPYNKSEAWQDYIKSIVLIEPSKVALNRAEAIAKLKFPDASVRTVNKKLEELSDNDLSFETNKVMIHIFSQVLDIPLTDDFNLTALFEKITSIMGTHYIHIVSHDVDDDSDQRNILKLYKYIVSKYVRDEVTDDEIRFVLRAPIKEPVKLIKTATNMALNMFEIQGSGKVYDCIAMFACIKTY